MTALVFVHGYYGGGRQWAGQVEAFGSRFQVITPDLPGFGDNNKAVAPDSIQGFAGDVFAQLDAIGIDRFYLCGHSMGGMIVQQMTAMMPERIERLVLYGTGPIGMMPGRFETIDESRRAIREQGAGSTGRRIAATWFRDGEAGPGYELCVELALGATEQAALAGLTAMEAWSGEAGLAAIDTPTLVLWGDGDRAYMWEQPERLWRGIAGAELAVIPGCSHAVHLEKPQLFNATLQDFLEA
jgi:pimeloyl-ACP methyl ester carboxylesterase